MKNMKRGPIARRAGALLLCTVLAAGTLTTAAGAVTTSAAAQLSPNVSFVVDGTSRTFYNASGEEVHPILCDGVTYLPLRAVGELMDKNETNNSATVDSLLLVQAAYDLNNYVTFFLYEYGSSLVVNSSNMYYEEYDITMRTPDGVDHPLTGKMYTGGDRIYIDDAYTDEVLTALRGEGDIMFYIVNSDRTVENYLVTIPASNFGELYDEMVQG